MFPIMRKILMYLYYFNTKPPINKILIHITNVQKNYLIDFV